MSNRRCVRAIVGVLSFTVAIATSAAEVTSVRGLNEVFDSIRLSSERKDLAAFERLWHPDGFASSLVGDSGIPGSDVYAQSVRKGWYLRPEIGTLRVVTGTRLAFVTRCQVWLPSADRAVDAVDVVLVQSEDRWVLLGSGEDTDAVVSLAKRWVDQLPLAPTE